MPQIIQTRYRDIPFEDLKKCAPTGHMTAEEWDYWRGRPIQIYTPPIENGPDGRFICGGPLYDTGRTAKLGPGWKVAVCPHIAEIGD